MGSKSKQHSAAWEAQPAEWKLTQAVTEYDARESIRALRLQARGKLGGRHNIYALSQYFAGIEKVVRRVAQDGLTLREALCQSFTGRLLDHCLKAVGEAPSTREEQRW